MSKKRIKVGLNGAGGRMGLMLTGLIVKEADLELVAALEVAGHPGLGKDVGLAAGLGEVGVKLGTDLPVRPDVMVDFSTPAATMECLRICVAGGIAEVIGTTGLSEAQVKELKASALKIPVVFAPNMSVGVNVLVRMVGEAARMLGPGYSVEIVETHHRFKKDAPSGTALKLAESVAKALGRDVKKDVVYGRQGQVGERKGTEIGVHAVRAGDVVGEHVVTFATMGERVEMVHRASSRETFGRGALRAARFVAGKPAGLYGMEDVLGL